MNESVGAAGVHRDNSREARFVQDILDIARRDRGRIAGLQRNLGRPLAEARNSAWFFGLTSRYRFHPVQSANEDLLFLAATLLSIDRRRLLGGASGSGSFGRTLRELARATGRDEAIERRLRLLLDAGLGEHYDGELAYRLAQVVRLAVSQNCRIDWPQLIRDITNWDHPDKVVQRKWARDYYETRATGETETHTAD